MNNIVIILAAGNSTRCNFANNIPKQYQKINNQILLSLVIEKFLPYSDLVLVVNSDHAKYYQLIKEKYHLKHIVKGGKTRQESVFNALQYIKKLNPDNVMIHDGARIFVSDKIIRQSLELLKSYKAVVPVMPIVDTIREIKDNNSKTINRNNLYKIQTPQSFSYELLYDAYKNIKSKNLDWKNYTDDAAIIEDNCKKIKFFTGAEENFKITTQDDFIMAQNIYNQKIKQKINKVAIGYDVHAFSLEEGEGNNYIILGGIKIPYKYKIIAHSDGDVLIHALVDAMLGVMAAGDIGDYFPDNDKKYQNANSLLFLEKAQKLLLEKDFQIVNIDANIITQEPKITPYKIAIRKNLANFLNIDINQINIKATTSEKLGFIGRKEGIAVQVIINVI